MKLYFKQRFFSWFDSYDIYDYDTGDVVYTVEGQLAWGHCLHILDAGGRHIAHGEAAGTDVPAEVRPVSGRRLHRHHLQGVHHRAPTVYAELQRLAGAGDFRAGSTRSQTGSGRWPPSQGAAPLDGTYVIDVADGRDGLCA